MDAVDGPELLEGGLPTADPVDGQRDRIAHRRAVRGGQREVGIPPRHARGRLRGDIPLEWEDDLHDRAAGLGHEPPQDRLVAGERLGIVRGDVVVGREIEEHEIGLVGQHVPVDSKHPQLGARAADATSLG